MVMLGQNATVYRGEGRTIEYLIPGAAGITGARYAVAASATTPADARLIYLVAGDDPEISVASQGPDLVVSVHLTPAITETLTPGPLYAELALVHAITGEPFETAIGTLSVRNSQLEVPA